MCAKAATPGDYASGMSSLVVVTGGSAGLGRALLAAAPDAAYRVDVSRSGPPSEADEHLAADLAEPAAWAQVGDRLKQLVDERDWTRVTLIHCAGTLDPIGFAGEMDGDRYTANVLVNAASALALGQRFLVAVADTRARCELALVSSGAARSTYPGWSAYGAAKAAGDHWVRTVGAEQQQRGGVRVLSVAPGVVATAMQAMIRDTDAHDFPQVEKFRELYETGGLTDPADAAEAFWRLLDDDGVPTGSVVDLRER
jgi:benzil reductase ((S)-benzoin forming)